MPLSEIGPQVGGADQSHFTALFRKTPTYTETPCGGRCGRRGVADLPRADRSLLLGFPSIGSKRTAARGLLVGRVLSPPARFAHDSNICSTNVTDGTGPRPYIILYTHVVGYPTRPGLVCHSVEAGASGRFPKC
jgi:hypothetical protein